MLGTEKNVSWHDDGRIGAKASQFYAGLHISPLLVARPHPRAAHGLACLYKFFPREACAY